MKCTRIKGDYRADILAPTGNFLLSKKLSEKLRTINRALVVMFCLFSPLNIAWTPLAHVNLGLEPRLMLLLGGGAKPCKTFDLGGNAPCSYMPVKIKLEMSCFT